MHSVQPTWLAAKFPLLIPPCTELEIHVDSFCVRKQKWILKIERTVIVERSYAAEWLENKTGNDVCAMKSSCRTASE
jgi:hypothetical protein